MTDKTTRDETRERVAKAIASAVTRGGDPEVKVLPEWPPMQRFHGGFVSAPPDGAVAPLWHFFVDAADAAIKTIKNENPYLEERDALIYGGVEQ